MPSLQEIRQFNDSLVRLADEPDVLSEWGEQIEALPEPEEGLDTDLSSLLEDTGDVTVPTMGMDDGVPVFDDEVIIQEAAAGERPDFSELLGDDLDQEPSDEGPVEPEQSELAGAGAGEAIDFAPTAEMPEDEELREPSEAGDEAAPPEFDEAIEPAGVEDDVDFSDFAALLGDESPLGDVAEETEQPFADDAFAEDVFAEDAFAEEPFDAGAKDEGVSPPEEIAPGVDEAFDAADMEEIPGVEEPGFPFGEQDISFGDETVPSLEEIDEAAAAETVPEETTATGEYEFGDEEPGEEIPDFTADEDSFDESAMPDLDDEESPFVDVEAFGSDGDVGDEGFDEFDEPDAAGLDDFSLGDFGAEFEAAGDEGLASEEDLNPALSVSDLGPGPPAAPGEFQISNGQFGALRATMASLPLNLRIEVEGIVTEAKGTNEDVEELIRGLASRQSPQDIAALASRILGRQIRVPRGYEKRTGLEFEAERQSFAYQFRHNILPILRLVAVFAVGLAVLALAGYHLVFRPLYGRSLYNEGLALIREDQYSLGNQTFVRAREVWPATRWFYRYATAFADERQYTLAGEKYEQLLFGMSVEEREYYNELLDARRYMEIVNARDPEKQGVLEYANLESATLGNYARADRLLQLILAHEPSDYDGWLAVGDNNMRWADEDPSRYEAARLAYARLMDRHGQTTELLFRMLTYFVRTDNLSEVLVLKDIFQSDPRLEVEPERYAEMSGYLLDKGLLEDVEDMLFRAFDVDPEVPQIHYHLARFYRMIGSRGEEGVALHNTLAYLEDTYPLTPRLRRIKVDALTRVGENLYEVERYVDAQEAFADAIAEYEEGLRRRVLAPEPMFGRAYSYLGDIFYYVARSYDDAYRQYVLAEENGYDVPDVDYKQGFVLYRNGQVNSALSEFLEVAEDPSGSTNALLWATANTYYRRGNYFAAEAYYRELLDRVERQRDNIRTLLVDEDPRHQSIIEYLIKTNNNLGVALIKLAAQTGNPNHSSGAMIHLTEAIEYSENYRRDSETMVRSRAVSMAYLNQREILYPTPEYSFQIYVDLPEDLDDPLF